MNTLDLMKNPQAIQSVMDEAREKLRTLRQDGQSGGELVKVTINGNMEAISVSIDPIAVNSKDIKMLEELIAASFTDAVRKMHQTIQQEMKQMASGIPMPPGLLD